MWRYRTLAWLIAALVFTGSGCHAYLLAREYAGDSFFDRWDFFGSWDNLTLGDVWWLDRQDASNDGLAYVNGAGNAILRVDNFSTVPVNEKRNSVRITSTDLYDLGSLWVIDILHLPFGCSVWPAFWTKGPLWPNDGEIDIIEAVNLMSANQMALHTTPGCTHTTPVTNQLGQSAGLGPGNVGGTGLNSDGENASDCSTGAGCTVTETKDGSFGEDFRDGGGGVFAAQFDIAGVFIWFWPRSQVPQSIIDSTSTSSMSLDDWGTPSASYLSDSCTIQDFFTSQQLVLDITLCGDWAGVPAVYNATCANTGRTGICYNDNVVGSGSNYDDAYFEISHLRAYTTAPGLVEATAVFDSSPSQTVGAVANNGKRVRLAGPAEWAWMSVFMIVLGIWVGALVVL